MKPNKNLKKYQKVLVWTLLIPPITIAIAIGAVIYGITTGFKATAKFFIEVWMG